MQDVLSNIEEKKKTGKIRQIGFSYHGNDGVERDYTGAPVDKQAPTALHILELLRSRSPDGLAQAFIIGEEFIGDDTCAMVLGDNIFYGNGFTKTLLEAKENAEKGIATVFGYYVEDPERFGVVEFDENQNVISIEEKPKNPKSNYCVTGLYFYDNRVASFAKSIEKSARGEYEITDLNVRYLKENALSVKLLGRGFAWLDTGTMESLSDASDFVRMVESRQSIMISAPEEIAYIKGWINNEELLKAAERYGKSTYGAHLKKVAEGKYKY